jgi:hypothetical protein
MSAVRLFVPVAAVAALALTACNKPAATAPPPTSALAKATEFAKCQWETVKGSGYSIQAFACGPEQGNMHMVADDSLPGFTLVSDQGRKTAVRMFGKPATSPITAVLAPARAVSRGPQTRTCEFELQAGADPAKKRYVLTPVGDAKTAWEKNVKESKDVVAEPCGPLGVAVTGDRYFFELPGHPEVVVWTDMGSEIQIFDPETIVPISRQ